jgi:type IV pilus assembly protein PilE
MMENRLKTQAGFTLVELMITLMVLVIVVSLALPSYRAYTIRAHRSEGIDALMTAAICQERIFTRTNAYDANQCGGLTTNGYYNIGVATQNGNQEFTLTATPQGGQTEDACGALTINQIGVRGAGGSGGDEAVEARCWAGRGYVSASS